MNLLQRLSLLALSSALLACAQTKVTHTGPSFPSREPQCSFAIYTVPPVSGFMEIGIIDVTAAAKATAAAFRRQIRDDVCKAGGDAVVVYVNGYGVYIKATILKAVPASSSSLSDGEQVIDPGGCRFDTQCKGDRLCVQGGCVDPPIHSAGVPLAEPAN